MVAMMINLPEVIIKITCVGRISTQDELNELKLHHIKLFNDSFCLKINYETVIYPLFQKYYY